MVSTAARNRLVRDLGSLGESSAGGADAIAEVFKIGEKKNGSE